MSKIYKGHELIKAIADGEIKEDTKIKVSNIISNLIYDGYTLMWENSLEIAYINYFIDKNATFELIEDEEIDIDSIEKIDEERYIITDVLKKINELVQAVKQLDKRKSKDI